MDKKEGSIFCINFRDFETLWDFQMWSARSSSFKFANLNIDEDKGTYLDWSKVFDRVDKIWLIDKYIIAIQNNGDDEMIMSPDLERYIREESVDATKGGAEEEVEEEEADEEVETNVDMTIDSILDKISLVGVENLTKAEKRFLNKK